MAGWQKADRKEMRKLLPCCLRSLSAESPIGEVLHENIRKRTHTEEGNKWTCIFFFFALFENTLHDHGFTVIQFLWQVKDGKGCGREAEWTRAESLGHGKWWTDDVKEFLFDCFVCSKLSEFCLFVCLYKVFSERLAGWGFKWPAARTPIRESRRRRCGWLVSYFKPKFYHPSTLSKQIHVIDMKRLVCLSIHAHPTPQQPPKILRIQPFSLKKTLIPDYRSYYSKFVNILRRTESPPGFHPLPPSLSPTPLFAIRIKEEKKTYISIWHDQRVWFRVWCVTKCRRITKKNQPRC